MVSPNQHARFKTMWNFLKCWRREGWRKAAVDLLMLSVKAVSSFSNYFQENPQICNISQINVQNFQSFFKTSKFHFFVLIKTQNFQPTLHGELLVFSILPATRHRCRASVCSSPVGGSSQPHRHPGRGCLETNCCSLFTLLQLLSKFMFNSSHQ